MSNGQHVIAVDLGAESGRVIKVRFDGARLSMEDVHRFPNIPVQAGGTLHWDALRLWHEMQTGIDMALDGAASIGLDTWGVDFALLDRDGRLVGNPVHYRDSRTNGMTEWVFERIPRDEVFAQTGIQLLQINTLFQLASLVRANSAQLERAETLITIADLFTYWLTGHVGCEYTMATTTQMFDVARNDWAWDLLERAGIPRRLFPTITPSGSRVGDYRGVPVIAPACHDTGSAVVAVPTTSRDFAYISSGTWSLMGMEIAAPVVNDACYQANMTNEGGVNGTIRLLKNVMGLWLAQQARATWRAQGHDYDYDVLAQLGAEAEPFRSLIDPDDASFLPPGDMPERIREFCRQTGQPTPDTPGQVMRAIYESLALKYRLTLDKLMGLTGLRGETIHIVGGGSRNALLCQMTADACNRLVVAGPVEATALGNAIVQMIALGEFEHVAQAREMLSRTAGTVDYTPRHSEAWEAAYGRFRGVLTTE